VWRRDVQKMIASRGMGDIAPSKMPGKKIIKRKDNPNNVSVYKKGGEVWDKPRPKSLGKPKKLSPAKKAAAKAMAKKAGRPYPNLVDNIRAAK
jgi:hypothetical protein